jgi:thiosulfate/3-mercaptopyruvate sulfurtransferase
VRRSVAIGARAVGRGGLGRARWIALLATAACVAAAEPAPRADAPAPKSGTPAGAADSVRLPRHRPDDPWRADQLVTPQALRRALDSKPKATPLLVDVGFGVLYRGGHIPNSEFAGPASKLDGLNALRGALKGVPRERPVVLYCGCCPWGDCPNVRPAFRAAEKMGFSDVRVLYLPRSLQQDWIDRGYGVERAEK